MMTEKSAPKEPSEKKISVFTEAVLLAIIPALGYIVAFSYEFGRADYYGIPPSIISVSADTFFVSIVSVLAVAVILFFALLIIFLYVVGIYFVSLDIGKILIALVISVVIIAYIYILPILKYRNIEGWINRIMHDRVLDEIADAKSPLRSFLYRFTGTGLTYLIVIFAFSYIFAEELGRTAAITKDEYFVIPSQSFKPPKPADYAVLAFYGETIVAAPLDRTQNSIQQSFVFVRLNEPSGIYLKREKIGPIKVISD